jgi:hypothetical protein
MWKQKAEVIERVIEEVAEVGGQVAPSAWEFEVAELAISAEEVYREDGERILNTLSDLVMRTLPPKPQKRRMLMLGRRGRPESEV